MQYFLPDALGSARQLTGAAGALALVQSFDPYGGLLSSQGSAATPYGFTGEWGDASGLLYLRARYYLPQAGIFTSRDTWIGDFTAPASLNRYVYTNNNPVRFSDPSGHSVPLPPTPFSDINIPVSNGWDLVAATTCFFAGGFLPVHFESYGLGQGAIVGDKAPKFILPLVIGVQLSPEAAAISRPDLFRGGSSADPNFSLRTPDKPYRNGEFDIAPDANGYVGPGSGGLSTLSEPKPNWQNPWKYPSSAPDPEGIRIFQDTPTKNPNHWLWEPAWDMPLKQFKQFLKNTFEYWVHPE